LNVSDIELVKPGCII